MCVTVMKTLPKTFNMTSLGEAALVAVGAEWCGYCKQAKPVLKEVSKALKGRLNVYWVDGDKRTDLVTKWKVDGFPTIFLKTAEGGVFMYNAAVTFEDLMSFVCHLRKDLCVQVRNIR